MITQEQFDEIKDLRPYLLKGERDYTTDCLHYLGDLHQLLHVIQIGGTIGLHDFRQYQELLSEFKAKLDKLFERHKSQNKGK